MDTGDPHGQGVTWFLKHKATQSIATPPDCVVPENIHTPKMEGLFGLNPPPLWKFKFRLTHSFKNFGL